MLERIFRRINSFKREAHEILSVHEAAPSRAVLLDESYNRLQKLSLAQDELLRQALRCIENRLFRASHILAWTAFMDLIENILASDNFRKLNSVRMRWNISTLDELRENFPEFQIIEACKDLKLASKSEMRVLHGFLSKRNLCAHPSDFFPDYNQTLGYISDILSMIRTIQERPY